MKKVLPKRHLDPFARLIWRAQISILRACPSLCGMVVDGTFHSQKNRIRSLLLLGREIPRALILHLRDKCKKRIVLGQLVFGITTRCKLNCDKCISHVPDLKCRKDTPTNQLLADIQTLFSSVDYIYDLCFGGGEPMLHPDLDLILRACSASEKTGTIKVLTSGTVIPDEKLLAALRETKARVNISDYPNAPQPDMERIKAVLAENGICYSVYPAVDSWVDTDSFGQLKKGLPTRRFRDCILRLYYVYMAGQLHLCCQSAIMAYDGRIPDCKEDYINLQTTNPVGFREQFKKLNQKNCVSACSYCLGQSYHSPKIPPAMQRAPERREKGAVE